MALLVVALTAGAFVPLLLGEFEFVNFADAKIIYENPEFLPPGSLPRASRDYGGIGLASSGQLDRDCQLESLGRGEQIVFLRNTLDNALQVWKR